MIKKTGTLDIETLFQAADDHALGAGHLDYAVGDLQEILRAAWRLMTDTQRVALFDQPELIELAELPEYSVILKKEPNKKNGHFD